jgi:MFS family permease
MLQAVEAMERIDAAHVTGAARTRLQLSLIVNFFLLMPLYSGVPGVLLPNQIAQLSPASKENNLALLFAITSFFSTLATPIAAALSDRTHSRWGRCSPWIAQWGLSVESFFVESLSLPEEVQKHLDKASSMPSPR